MDKPAQEQKNIILGFRPELRTHRHTIIFRFETVQETTFQFSKALIVQVLSRFIRKCFEIPQESLRLGERGWRREEGVGERELFLRSGRMEELRPYLGFAMFPAPLWSRRWFGQTSERGGCRFELSFVAKGTYRRNYSLINCKSVIFFFFFLSFWFEKF